MDERTRDLAHIRNEMVSSFDEIKDCTTGKNKNAIDYDYEITRDRKALIIIKTITTEVFLENMLARKKKFLT